jgi:hypothetical protein
MYITHNHIPQNHITQNHKIMNYITQMCITRKHGLVFWRNIVWYCTMLAHINNWWRFHIVQLDHILVCGAVMCDIYMRVTSSWRYRDVSNYITLKWTGALALHDMKVYYVGAYLQLVTLPYSTAGLSTSCCGAVMFDSHAWLCVSSSWRQQLYQFKHELRHVQKAQRSHNVRHLTPL